MQKNQIKFRSRCIFSCRCEISLHCTFEGTNKIYDGSRFEGSMGYGSYIGPNCDINAIIGRFTSIAPGVTTNNGTHPISFPYVSSSPLFYSIKKQNGHTFVTEQQFDEYKGKVHIGNDVWIGQNVFISGGVTIGDGAVVLAGSVVVSDIEPYAIVGGVPAKIIKFRYNRDIIDILLNYKWWEKNPIWLKEHATLFSNLDSFVDFIKKEQNEA